MFTAACLGVLFLASADAPHPAAAPKPEQSRDALDQLIRELAIKPEVTPELAGKKFASIPLTKADAAAARKALWQAHAAFLKKNRAAEMKAKLLKEGKLEMPFAVREFGKKPAAGHSLWISLHGGGGAPKRVNDQQWENQKGLYKLKEGLYLAPRAPTNTWNLWHEAHIDRLFTRLIEDFIAIEGINPDRVFVMGYSAGGDGVYQLAPRMADSFAAAAMMAGHPNDASPLGLRNLPFALQVGALDKAYNRNRVALEWKDKLDQLHKNDPGGYEHFVKIHEGKGHWMNLEDKVALPWMAKFSRNPTPKRIVWKQASTTHDRFYWLAVPKAVAGALVEVKLTGQTIEILKAEKIGSLLIRLDDRLLNLDRKVKVVYQGQVLFEGLAPRTASSLVKSLLGRGDPQLMFDAEIAVELK